MISYTELLQRQSFTKEELLALSWGRLVSDPPEEGCGSLPIPPMQMFDRVTHIEHNGRRGRIIACQDIHLDAWFFQCHFVGDPVQPGCLGVDAIWQLMGVYGAVRGATGAGRALGAKEIEFFGQIRPHNKEVRYEVDIRRYSVLKEQGAVLIMANAEVLVDDEAIYTIKDAKVGFFTGIKYKDYPFKSEMSLGGKMVKD